MTGRGIWIQDFVAYWHGRPDGRWIDPLTVAMVKASTRHRSRGSFLVAVLVAEVTLVDGTELVLEDPDRLTSRRMTEELEARRLSHERSCRKASGE